MIKNDGVSNMGGVVSLSLYLHSDVVGMRILNGSAIISPGSYALPLSVYFTPGTALINIEPQQGVFRIGITWRSPKDRPELYEAILPYINQKVIIIATYSTGQQKIFGSIACPLVLTYAPTPQGSVTDYNGVSFVANGIDFLPGRYPKPPDPIVPPVPEPTYGEDDFLEAPDNLTLVSRIKNVGEAYYSDFDKTPILTESGLLSLIITEFLSTEYCYAEFTRMFDEPVDVTTLELHIESITPGLNWVRNDPNVLFQLTFTYFKLVGSSGVGFIPEEGIKSFSINQPITGYKLQLLRFNESSEPCTLEISKVVWNFAE